MRVSLYALAVAMAGMTASTAYAQLQSYPQNTPAYASYYAAEDEASPSDKQSDRASAAAAPGEQPAPPANGNGAKQECPCQEEEEEEKEKGWYGHKSCGLFDPCCELGDQWKLFDCPCLKCNNRTIAGWIDQGFTANPDNPADRFNGPVTFNDRANEYQMNQLYLYMEQATDTGGCGWDWGYRTDLLYGTDYRFTLAQGLDAMQDFTPRFNSGRFYGLAIPQVYGEVAYDDVKVKIGHFYTIIGYEVVTAPGNFFYSHAYTHQYGEPFTNTGALASWTPNKEVTFYNGIVRGWDNWSDPDNSWSYLGGVTLTRDDAKESLAFALIVGDEPNINGGFSNRYMQSVVYTNKFTDEYTYVFESDFGVQQNGNIGGTSDGHWYSATNYLYYKYSECMSWGWRFEWMRDEDGIRVAPVGDFQGSNVASVGGFAGNFYDITFGVNYKWSANLMVRPEVRYDWFDGDALNGVQPYDAGTDDDQFLAAFDVLYTF